jgi:hypothetical protein
MQFIDFAKASWHALSGKFVFPAQWVIGRWNAANREKLSLTVHLSLC